MKVYQLKESGSARAAGHRVRAARELVASAFLDCEPEQRESHKARINELAQRMKAARGAVILKQTQLAKARSVQAWDIHAAELVTLQTAVAEIEAESRELLREVIGTGSAQRATVDQCRKELRDIDLQRRALRYSGFEVDFSPIEAPIRERMEACRAELRAQREAVSSFTDEFWKEERTVERKANRRKAAIKSTAKRFPTDAERKEYNRVKQQQRRARIKAASVNNQSAALR